MSGNGNCCFFPHNHMQLFQFPWQEEALDLYALFHKRVEAITMPDPCWQTSNNFLIN